MEHEGNKPQIDIHPLDHINLSNMVGLMNHVSSGSLEPAKMATHLLTNALVIAGMMIQLHDDHEANDSFKVELGICKPSYNNVGSSFADAERIIRHWCNTLVRNDDGCKEPHEACLERHGSCPQEGQMYRTTMRVVETLFIQLSEAKHDHGNEADEGTT